jgi:arginyl-tRNA synthetase
MATYLETLISVAVSDAFRRTAGGAAEPAEALLRPGERPEHGDFSTNLALVAASSLDRRPRDVAEALARQLESADNGRLFRDVRVAGPGFVNVFLQPSAVQGALSHLLKNADHTGKRDIGKGRTIQLEYVSSNPTGPLTVGHGRQAVLGDVLANLYEQLGYQVEREYYFNDEGRQIDLLAESLWVRYRETFGEAHEIPDDGYHGDYLREVAAELRAEIGDRFQVFDETAREHLRAEGVARMTAWIKEDLARLGVRFDRWFSEAALHRSGEVPATLDALRNQEGIYEADGAVWLRAEEHGGAKDSVVIRSDGRPTYLMVDIAYHLNKRARGFDRVINVQGADHHTQQTCVQAGLRILGVPDGWLTYAVHQFVSLKEGGETLKMSTRAGRFVTLRDLIDELGSDIVRYFMISRKPEAHLDFDLDLARNESLDNPATYVQYAHTRISSIFRRTEDKQPGDAVDLSVLTQPEEIDLIKMLDRFPAIVETAGLSFAPHLLADYALQLARAFHAYYDRHRVLGDDPRLTAARLALLHGLRIVLRRCLGILGMDAPEEM